MNKSKNGGYADYDDPDFDSEWFDDEAYDRALAQGYDEDAYESRTASQAPSSRVRQGPPSRSRGTRNSPWPLAIGSIAAVLLAAGAGYYVVATFADTGFVRRLQTAYQVLRGGAPTMVVESPSATPSEAPREASELPEQTLTGIGPAELPPAASSAVSALPAASAETRVEPPGDDFGPGVPVATSVGAALNPASAPQRVEPLPAARVPIASSSLSPGLAASPKTAQSSRASAGPKPVALMPSPSPRLSSALARQPVASPSVSRVSSVVLPAKRLKLSFAPGTVALTGGHVEAMWMFASSLEGQPGRYVVQGYLGYGRLAPSLAQQRAQAVAGVLRRQQARTKTPVDVRVMSQPVQGVAGRQVEIIFSPQRP